VVADRDRGEAYTLVLDGAAQSYVDLADPTYLGFEYVRRLGHLVDLVAPAGRALDVVHLGGGGLTLPRYVAATRAGSRQRVVELDGALVELVRRELPLRRDCRPRVRIGDARAVLAERPDGSADLLVVDVYGGSRIPAHLTTVEFVAEAARVLRPGGTYLANVADGAGLAFARGQVATVRTGFGRVLLAADAAVLKGRRFGNLVLAAGDRELPVAELTRLVVGDAFPGRVLAGDALDGFVGGAAPVTDATARVSPQPPAGLFGVA
jgi:spermidine synthase